MLKLAFNLRSARESIRFKFVLDAIPIQLQGNFLR